MSFEASQGYITLGKQRQMDLQVQGQPSISSKFQVSQGRQGSGPGFQLQEKGGASSAQCLDISVSSGGSLDQGHLHGL